MSRASLRERWHQEVLRTKRIHDACRVLLIHLATGVHRDGPHAGQPLMTATGYVRNVKHVDLARDLNIAEKQVGRRLQEARDQGLLVIVGGGHNGQPTMYAAQLPDALKAPVLRGPSGGPATLHGFVKAPAHKGPSAVAERGPSAAIEGAQSVTKTPAERGPYVRARARATKTNREREPAPHGSRAHGDHDVTSQAGSNGSGLPTPFGADLTRARGDVR